jgi:hypothetical protein
MCATALEQCFSAIAMHAARLNTAQEQWHTDASKSRIDEEPINLETGKHTSGVSSLPDDRRVAGT